MEKGIARLVEAAAVAAQSEGYDITLEIVPEGVRAKITWVVGHPGRRYAEENLTTWKQLHPAPDTSNPLIWALDDLVRRRTEFQE